MLTPKCKFQYKSKYVCVFLQIEARSADDETVDGPYSVVLQVVDVNNNHPVFSESQYSGRVREHSPAGEKYMHYQQTLKL